MDDVPFVCRQTDCVNAIPVTLSSQQLCLDHFLDEVFARTNQALDLCGSRQRISAVGVEQLLADALTIVEQLENEAREFQPEQRDRMLELLLMLANLHEYVARQPVKASSLA